MAKARPSVQKRIKEAKAHEKKQIKAARKAARDAARMDRTTFDEGVDPDLVGLVAGPQEIIWDEAVDGPRPDAEEEAE
ncbi:MAG: hypothetical protein KC912_24515 [Proteobacteria bacterium]|nr:hypothetical protein [Pseudomonadota bacterium]